MADSGKMTHEQLRKFEQGWADMMVDILHDRISMLRIVDTGSLYRSVRKRKVTDRTIEHQFLEYGIYVANGVGNGYKKGNGGYLEILDKEYRREHGMKSQRRKRDWFFKKYYYSMYRLNEKEAEMYGEGYQGLMRELISSAAYV